MKAIVGTDAAIVALAIAAQKAAEKAESGGSPSRWKEADCYAELAKRGWTVRKIADECGTNKTSAAIFIQMVSGYPDRKKRPSFWTAYSETTGENKTTAERIVASNENEWYTPKKYVTAVRKVLGKIDLDPASSKTANKTVKATHIYTAADDSLRQPWKGRVFLNPPYGRLAGDFIQRLVLEYQAGEVKAAIALVNAHCTDTEWFQPLWDYTVCFTDHRIDFDSAGRQKHTTSTHGSAFAYMGPHDEKFLREFSAFGAVMRRA